MNSVSYITMLKKRTSDSRLGPGPNTSHRDMGAGFKKAAGGRDGLKMHIGKKGK